MKMKAGVQIAWLTWFIASLFYSIEFFQRVSPTVMASPIMHTLGMDAATFSVIISFYFYACAIAQIPVGFLLDRWQARYLLTAACFSVSFGSLLFAIGQQEFILGLSRIIIGLGSAFAFIGVLKLSANWFAPRQFPIIVGLTNTLGVLGAVVGEAPYAKLVNLVGWQEALIIISLLGLVVSLLIFLLIRDHPRCWQFPEDCDGARLQQGQVPHLKETLVKVLVDKQTWLTAVYAGLMVAPIIAFAELWAVPFLMHVYHLHNVHASEFNTLIFIGIACGGPFHGYLASFTGRPKFVMWVGNIFALGSFCILLYVPQLKLLELGFLLFAFGFFTSSMLIAFTLNKERHTENHHATVVGFTNMIILIFGAIYQDIIGVLLKSYSVPGLGKLDFTHALAVLPATLLVNLILLKLIRPVRAAN